MTRRYFAMLCLLLAAANSMAQETDGGAPGPDRHHLDGAAGPFVAERVLAGLSQPAAIEFLPDGRALVAQRNTGTLSLADFSAGTVVDVTGMPRMLTLGDSGLHDIERHPDYDDNGWIYISYSEGEEIHSTVVLDRLRLAGERVAVRERLFTAEAYTESPYHYGGRIRFLDGYVYMTVGDRQHPERAQDRSSHAGTVVRLHDDGRVPEDNPFAGGGGENAGGRQPARGAPPRPEIWSWGHRNPQGLVVDRETGVLWANEHGPRGGDELNRIVRGGNYGWPVITYGFEYDGGPVGMGIVRREGMEQPAWVYVPSIAPSDLVIYEGDAFPGWRGSMLSGALALTHLNRLSLADGVVVLEERLVRGVLGRIRAIAVGPHGFVYLGNDAGEIWRLRP